MHNAFGVRLSIKWVEPRKIMYIICNRFLPLLSKERWVRFIALGEIVKAA